jgi:hypothetical protein
MRRPWISDVAATSVRPSPRRTWAGALLLGVVLATVVAGCGGSGETGSQAVRTAAQVLDDWARTWGDDVVDSAGRPTRFAIPRPPQVQLPAFAAQLERDVDVSAAVVSRYLRLGYEHTRSVYCYWFGWYVETGNAVPSPEEFPALLLRYGFGVVAPDPPPQQVVGAIELLRGSIERAQSGEQAAMYAATAAACSLPG